MGAWEQRSRLQLVFYTVMFCLMPNKYLQIISSATVIPTLAKTNMNSTSTAAEWKELKAKCRFGHLLNTGECQCRNAECIGFELDPVCMKRDSGNHRTWPNSCYMIEHACNARKKRLYYWKGNCGEAKVEAREVAGEYCEGDDVSYCKNDGLCKFHNTLRERQCICKRGYYGVQCQHKRILLSRRRRYRDVLRRLKRMLRFRTRRSVNELDTVFTLSKNSLKRT